MAVDKHPSRKPAQPFKPPRTTTTSGTDNKILDGHGSGQHGVPYGFRHEISVKDPSRSEMSHHFHAHHESNEPSSHHVGKAGHPGDEKGGDEPG